jgi:hypothetical protein
MGRFSRIDRRWKENFAYATNGGVHMRRSGQRIFQLGTASTLYRFNLSLTPLLLFLHLCSFSAVAYLIPFNTNYTPSHKRTALTALTRFSPVQLFQEWTRISCTGPARSATTMSDELADELNPSNPRQNAANLTSRDFRGKGPTTRNMSTSI